MVPCLLFVVILRTHKTSFTVMSYNAVWYYVIFACKMRMDYFCYWLLIVENNLHVFLVLVCVFMRSPT